MREHEDYPGAAGFVPGARVGLAAVARAAQDCRGCDLFERATQTVFGRGNEPRGGADRRTAW